MLYERLQVGWHPRRHQGMLGKNNAYITGTNAEVAVLLIHDIYGWKLPNIRLLADHFAQEADCTVYVADLYVSSHSSTHPPLCK